MKIRKAVSNSLGLLTRRDRRLLILSTLVQMATSLLDLLGVVLIGLVGALFVTTVQSQPPPGVVNDVAERFGLGSLSDQELVIALAGAAAVILLAKSFASSYLTRRNLLFLANRQASISVRLANDLLDHPLHFIQSRSTDQIAFTLVNGTSAATVQILGQSVIVATEVALLLVLGLGLMFVSPWVALASVVFFAVIAVILQRMLGEWASRTGLLLAQEDVRTRQAVRESIKLHREILVAGTRSHFSQIIASSRERASRAGADSQFLALVPKYILEAALIVGAFLLAGALFATQDAVAAVGTLALFLAAGSRIMPSLLRLQTSALGLKTSASLAASLFDLVSEMSCTNRPRRPREEGAATGPGAGSRSGEFIPSVVVDNVSLTYPDAARPALDRVSLTVGPGRSVAFVGASGAGKSTLADVILGVVEPDSGLVTVSGRSPRVAAGLWPGCIGYVPQEVFVAADSLRRNVALGLNDEAIDDQEVWRALEQADLHRTLVGHEIDLETPLGEGGLKLSGGQQQRLAIARALYSNPKLLVLDEATSSLDALTEDAIARTLRTLDGQVTTIVIAHRLSTVRDVETVVYLDNGSVVASGTFSDVVAEVPAFRKQANLMGLA